MKADDTDPLIGCLLALSSFHGSNTTRDMLTAGLPLVDNRLTPSLFQRAASRIGLVSKLVRQPLDKINQAMLPAVVLLNDEQACVLMALDRESGSASVIYPELDEAVVEVSLAELNQHYSGHTILARPRFRFDKRAPSASKPASGHWFWSALKANTPIYRDVLLAAFLINLFAIALPLFTMNVYDRVVPNRAIETLWMLAAGVVLVLIADVALRTMRGYFLDLAGRRVDIQLSARIMEQVLGMRLESKPQSAGSFAANLRSFETVRDFITSATITAVIDVPFTLIFVLVISWIAWPMIIPLLLGVVMVVIFAMTTRSKMQELSETTYRANAMRNATLIESLVGMDTLKAMGAEGMMQRKWEKAAGFLAGVGVQLRLLSSSNSNFTLWTQQMVAVSVVVIGVYLISAGELTMGGLIACSMLSARAIAPLAQVAGLTTQYHNAATALHSLDDVMQQPVERPPEARFLSRESFQGDIEFREVSFSYPGTDMVALKNASFKIRAGERVAFLGRVGSGKSTLQKLIMGLYQPTSGGVFVDGIDVRQLDPAELRHHIGYVPQDITLFYGSLRDNITLAHPLADDAAVVRAAEIANLNDFVSEHPDGFDMLVGERGESLSGGQRKAVALARGLIDEPPILLMDEPTGSMDHSTEAWVKKQLAEYAKGKTMLVVTHRTSLLDLVDRIIVMDNGKIVADGAKSTVVEALRQGRIGRAS